MASIERRRATTRAISSRAFVTASQKPSNSSPVDARNPSSWSSRSCRGGVVRYGFFYGPGTWFSREGDVGDQVRRRDVPVIDKGEGIWNWVHVEWFRDEGVSGTVENVDCPASRNLMAALHSDGVRTVLIEFAAPPCTPGHLVDGRERPVPSGRSAEHW